MRVKLTYFKPNGKYYAEGEYETKIPAESLLHPLNVRAPALFMIWNEVAEFKEQKLLPGLRDGHSDFTVLIDVPDHPHRHPHLIPGSEPDDAATGTERMEQS